GINPRWGRRTARVPGAVPLRNGGTRGRDPCPGAALWALPRARPAHLRPDLGRLRHPALQLPARPVTGDPRPAQPAGLPERRPRLVGTGAGGSGAGALLG